MSLDLQLLSSKLTRYRKQFDSSIDEVAAATGIPIESLTAYEQARSEPTGDEILILADYYKCDYKFFISNEQLAAFEQTETLFRSYSNELSKEDRWAIQEFLFLCGCEEFLQREFSHKRTPFVFHKTGKHYKAQAVSAALSLRRYLQYKTTEVGRDIYKDFRSIGFHVFRRHLSNSAISGLCIRHPFAGKCILVNFTQDIYRQRFTAAHEAGHAILDDDRDTVISFTWDKKDLSEIRANTFASRYLMPPEFLSLLPKNTIWNDTAVVKWSTNLMVSTEALAYALKDVGIVSQEEADVIRAVRIPRQAKTDPELPESLPPRARERKVEFMQRGLSDFYVNLCFKAYDQGLISAGRLGEMLLIQDHELASIANLYGQPLKHGD